MVQQDQKERNEYQKFVEEKANGDYDKGAEMYAKLKGRPSNDVFGELAKLENFIKMQFNFNSFSKQDWNNYWLLAQHCDFNRKFQQQALKNIEKFLGQNTDEFRYLSDRISCGLTGTQKFGTQNLCNKD